MSDHLTLIRLLEESGQHVVVYDVGRRVGRLPREVFAGFEAGTCRYPLPMQRKAWFAVVQLGSQPDAEPVIWFLTLSLDEQGLLIPAQRDYLLDRLLASANAGRSGDDAQAFLRDNPHAFTPRQDRMALFHARLGADLERPPSRFYAHALDYFAGKPGWDQWEFVGYQGIADVACRHAGAPLDAAVAALPREPLTALCHCLESQRIETTLLDALLARLARETGQLSVDSGVISALVRAISSRAGEPATRAALHDLIDRPLARDIEILAAISGRAWEALDDAQLRSAFLGRLAENSHGQSAFAHCIDDLLSLPDLAASVRSALQADGTPAKVREAFARMTASLETRPNH